MTTEQMPNANTENSEEVTAAADTSAERYLTFLSDGLTIGVSTDYVTEIITDHSITVLPMVPDFVKGIINLRGQIVPIIDIRLRMGKPMIEYTNTTCIIVLNIDSVNIGIMVDSVQQVLDIDCTQISSVPVEDQQGLINGMISLSNEEVLLVLNCEELVHTY